MEFRNESLFFGGSQYLERLDKLSTLYNEANLAHDVSLMYDILLIFKFELVPYMITTEKKQISSNLNEAKKQLLSYNREQEQNKRTSMVKRKNPYQKVIYYVTEKEKLRDYLNVELREMYQIIIKRSGLLMADKKSHTESYMDGLK